MPMPCPRGAERRRSSRPRRRRLVLALRRVRRGARCLHRRLMLLGGWTWVAAGSLVGFEALDLLFGSFLYAPELLPLVILALALVWLFRERLRAAVERHRWRTRLARFRRRAERGRLP